MRGIGKTSIGIGEMRENNQAIGEMREECEKGRERREKEKWLDDSSLKQMR